MTLWHAIRLFLATALLALPLGSQALALEKPAGPAVLTIVGAIGETNRPPFDEFEDGVFKFHERRFDKAAAFDIAMLEALGMHEITVAYPAWPHPFRFEGPRLKDVLANPNYEGIQPPRRLVINSQSVPRREKKEAEIKATGADSAPATIYHWVWDEFQVASAEPVGEQFFIFYNTLKFFHAGAPTTPLNRWVLSGRFKGQQILEANIDK